MLVELRQAGSEALLDRLELDDPPHPGRWLECKGRSFLVMQRHHRYTKTPVCNPNVHRWPGGGPC